MKAESELQKLERPWAWLRGLGQWIAVGGDGVAVYVNPNGVLVKGDTVVPLSVVNAVADANGVDGVRVGARKLLSSIERLVDCTAPIFDAATELDAALRGAQ